MRKQIFSAVSILALTASVASAANTVTKKATEVKNEMSQDLGTFSQENSARKATADAQMTGSDADVEVTRKIRDRLTDMDNLSTRAQNITIVTKGNNVTLQGEVDKQDEIRKILSVAQEVAAGKNVANQLRVHK